MENLNKGFVFVAVFLAAASLCDAGEKGRWDPRSAAEMHLYHADIQESVTKNVTTTTMASTETTTANPPPPSSSGYSLTYTHSTENGTVVVANDNDDNNNNSSIAKSRKKGDLEEEPVEDLPSLPDPPLHSEEADDTSTTRSVVPKKGLDSPASLEADAASGNGQHHHSGRIVPKKGVEAGDEDDGGIRNEMATTSEAPSVTDRQYNTTGSGDDSGGDGELNRVIVVPEHVESPSPAAENVPHVAEVPEPRHIPILNDRGRGQQQKSKSDAPRDADPSTPDTSLVVGLIFAATLFSVIAFLVFKRVRSAQRRREYRRMNDFLIDGMYNDL